jgi:hypothetical protein
MCEIEEIKSILKPLHYIPVVRKTEGGLLVEYPHPKLTKPQFPRLLEAFIVRRGENPGIFYNSSFFPEEKFVSVPEYAVRLFLMANIISCCKQIPISDDLIVFVDEQGGEHEDIEDVVEDPSTPKGVTDEGFLTKLVAAAREDNFSTEYEKVALTHGVHEGYKLVRTFF